MLKLISRVRIEFNALDPRAVACMDFLAQCNAREAKNSNPNCEIQVKRSVDETRPKIEVTFANGAEEVFDPVSTPAQRIRESILEKCEVVKSEEMFREAGVNWPVLIPQEELQLPFQDVKVKYLGSGKKEEAEGENMVTLQVSVQSSRKISEQVLRGLVRRR